MTWARKPHPALEMLMLALILSMLVLHTFTGR